MNFVKTLCTALLFISVSSMSETAQQGFYYHDANAVKVSLDEPSTGCVMSGVLVHPVLDPNKKVIWFNERTCGGKINKVSFISNEITSSENKIRKGEKLHVTPENVVIVDKMQL